MPFREVNLSPYTDHVLLWNMNPVSCDPIKYHIKIPAFVVCVEVGHWYMISSYPVISDDDNREKLVLSMQHWVWRSRYDTDVSRTHQILPDYIDAMV